MKIIELAAPHDLNRNHIIPSGESATFHIGADRVFVDNDTNDELTLNEGFVIGLVGQAIKDVGRNPVYGTNKTYDFDGPVTVLLAPSTEVTR